MRQPSKMQQKRLRGLLRKPLAEFGFSEIEPLRFEREQDDVTHQLWFGGRRSSFGTFVFNYTISVNFHAIDRLVSADSLLCGHLGVGVPHHFLHAGREYHEWELEGPATDEEVLQSVIADVVEYALPFLELNSDSAEVRRSLGSKAPDDGFTTGPEQAICILAAMDYLEGKKQEAIAWLERELEARAGTLPKERVLLEHLLRILTELERQV